MSNKKCKTETSVANLIKPKKNSTNFISNVNPSQTNSNKLTKRKRDDADSFHPNKPNNEEIPPDSFPDSFQKNNEDILPDSFLDFFTDFFPSNQKEER